MNRLIRFILLLATIPGLHALEEEFQPGLSLAASGGTLGAGMSIGYRFSPYAGIRLRGALLCYESRETWGNTPATLKLNGDNAALLLDIHPFGGNFYLTAGLTLSQANMRSKAHLYRKTNHCTEVIIGGQQFVMESSRHGTITAAYNWNHVQPYLGLGYTGTLGEDSGLYYAIDLGFNYMGSGRLRANSTGDLLIRDSRTYTWRDATQSEITAAMSNELSNFLDFAEKIRFYPVLQLSVGLRF